MHIWACQYCFKIDQKNMGWGSKIWGTETEMKSSYLMWEKMCVGACLCACIWRRKREGMVKSSSFSSQAWTLLACRCSAPTEPPPQPPASSSATQRCLSTMTKAGESAQFLPCISNFSITMLSLIVTLSICVPVCCKMHRLDICCGWMDSPQFAVDKCWLACQVSPVPFGKASNLFRTEPILWKWLNLRTVVSYTLCKCWLNPTELTPTSRKMQ